MLESTYRKLKRSALALMRGPEVQTLLEETRESVGDHPWGVGILGFVPAELRGRFIID